MAKKFLGFIGAKIRDLRAKHKKQLADRAAFQAKLTKLQQQHSDAISNKDYAGASALQDEIVNLMHSSGELKRAAAGDYSPALKSALGIAGVAASLNQINRANTALSGLTQPGIPSPPGVDNVLQNQIYQAQRGSMDAGKNLAAYNIGLNDAYNQAVNEANNTSSGQASIRQALVNEANLNKMRASVEAIPRVDAIRAREEGRADNLIGLQQQMLQQQYGNQINGAQLAQEMYIQKARAAGMLGAIGHSNLFGQLGDLTDTLPATFANPYMNPFSKKQIPDNAIAYENSLDAARKGGQSGYPYSNTMVDSFLPPGYSLQSENEK